MTLVLETNGRGFMGWIPELPGAFARGGIRDEVIRKIPGEVAAWAAWLEEPIPDGGILAESTVVTDAIVEDGDSTILLGHDRRPYTNQAEFDRDCGRIELSARKLQQVYESCPRRDTVVAGKVRATFYGEVPATIEAQFRHVVECHGYYLGSIGIKTALPADLRASRRKVIDLLAARSAAEGNRIHHASDEDWTLRKVVRRIVWHDRLHARAISRMRAVLDG